ncbi:glycosyltransferase [Flavobacterium sp.]|uniref:glycosyltransferase n=1 Tax=Flavobacterium sp. TaxID=239 RepID=UPI00286EA899|nr:glycosyltransferase [Flavobacterium sp.]
MEFNLTQDHLISSWIGNVDKPLVSILCDTFNHENYIEQAILGFLSQKTNFPIEIIIHDDASTDETVKIIKEYENKFPLIIKPIYQKENKYSNKNFSIWSDFTFPKAKGEFIALCEGDDYWTDELKIQKQVDYLKLHNNLSIVWTDYVLLEGNTFSKNEFSSKLPKELFIDFNNLFNPYCTLTLTSLFRKSAVNIKDYKKLEYCKDNSLYALALQNGNGTFLNFESAVHRKHPGGVYSLRPAFFQRYSSYLNVKEIFEKILDAKTKNIKFVVDTLLKEAAFEALKLYVNNEKLNSQHRIAIKNYLLSVRFKMKYRFLKQLILKKLISK